jgi:hypothetical protein
MPTEKGLRQAKRTNGEQTWGGKRPGSGGDTSDPEARKLTDEVEEAKKAVGTPPKPEVQKKIEEFQDGCVQFLQQNMELLSKKALKGSLRAQVFLAEQAVGRAVQRHEINHGMIVVVSDSSEIPKPQPVEDPEGGDTDDNPGK